MSYLFFLCAFRTGILNIFDEPLHSVPTLFHIELEINLKFII